MDAQHKKVLKAISLELRHLLEGSYDGAGQWRPGDLEKRLAAIGVRRDREPVRVDEMPHLAPADQKARQAVDAYLQLRARAGIARQEAVAEFVRETAYTWANRLLALRCMEARELIDEVILQKPAYGGRSLEHHRLAQRQPELCTGEDDGLRAVLDKVFAEQARRLPMLFDPEAPGIALKPSAAALRRCTALLSGTEAVTGHEPATPGLFQAPDAFGWAYQYWNIEEKDRVFEKVRSRREAKIEGSDIIPATQLYTEAYMVKFLVQNSLGAVWMGMHPESKLCDNWEYYVQEADRAERNSFRSPSDTAPSSQSERNEFRSTAKPVAEVTFLDPACGSGHFLLEAFDLFYAMYQEEGELTEPTEICDAILTNNLFGIDIDPRAVQIAEAVLWMKAAERAFGFTGKPTNLVAAVASHLKGALWEDFLAGFEREPSVARVLRQFAHAMEPIDQLGSLARPHEELQAIIQEQHAVWGRQVRTRHEADQLFPELTEDRLGGQVPFHEISAEEFGQRMLCRAQAAIHAFTEHARRKGAFRDRFLGSEASVGFQLIDMLDRKYDVVAANPPYLGSRQMGALLKAYLAEHYEHAKRDAYAAFILRCTELAKMGGRVAMVTQQSWMFLRSYAELRGGAGDAANVTARGFPGILRTTRIEVLAHLGPSAFADVGGEVVSTVMFVLAPVAPTVPSSHRITAYRLTSVTGSDSKKERLLRSIREVHTSLVHRPTQEVIAQLPQAPMAYWVSPGILRLLARPETIASVGGAKQGLATGANERFVRLACECRNLGRWRRYAKGGGYAKWFGLATHRVDWEAEGARVRGVTDAGGRPRCAVRNERTYFEPGITYTLVASGALGLRLLDNAAYDVASMSVVPESRVWTRYAVMAVLNSYLCSFLARLITQDLKFNTGYVTRLPLPARYVAADLDRIGRVAVALKRKLVAGDILEDEFHPNAIPGDADVRSTSSDLHLTAAILHTVEAASELVCRKGMGLTQAELEELFEETGSPAGFAPLIEGLDDMPPLEDLPLDASEVASTQRLVAQQLGETTRRCVGEAELADIYARLQSEYQADSLPESEDSARDEADVEAKLLSAQILIPTETRLEHLSRRLRIHPISVYWMLKEGIEKSGWRCLPDEARMLRDRMTVLVLQLLGHRWTRQLENDEAVPKWSDPDGIIPLGGGATAPTLLNRIRQRSIVGAGGRASTIDVEFAELMGKPLEQWLATDFFRHHVSQFKQRPIAWQLQSGKFTARTSPAFACLVYYHKLDADTLPKIRSQYVGPLKQRLETELRGIQAVAADARTDRQEERRVELDEAICELTGFDIRLEQVSRQGFATPDLAQSLADEPLDRWCSLDGRRPHPATTADLVAQELAYAPDINDGVRVNIAPLQKAGLLAADVLAKKDVDKALAARASWRADERRWCREGKLVQPGWWPEGEG